jgi:hypothetical protein
MLPSRMYVIGWFGEILNPDLGRLKNEVLIGGI